MVPVAYPLRLTIGALLVSLLAFAALALALHQLGLRGVAPVNQITEEFLLDRIESALAPADCPPVTEAAYPPAYYRGPLTDTHLHVPAIPDWPPAEDAQLQAEQLKGRFGGQKALLGWNVTMSDIACSLKHEGTANNFGLFPVYEDIPKPLIEVVRQTVRQYPELFVPFMGASGNDGDPDGFPVADAAAVSHMLGVYPGLFNGFGEIGLYAREGGGAAALPPDAPRLQEIYPLIKQHRLLVYFHPGRGQAGSLARVLAQHPEINFIVHGEEIEESLEYLLSTYPNIHYGIELGLGEEDPELSRLFVGNDKQKFLDAFDREFNRVLANHVRKWQSLIEKHPDRFIWGTDRGDAAWHYDREVGRALVRLARAFIGRLDAEAQEQFAYKNAERLAGVRTNP